MNWQKNINKVIDYCSQKGWEVEFSSTKENECDPTGETDGRKLICINTNRPIEMQFYNLLHEIGHMISEQNGKWHREKYPGFGYSTETVIHKTTTIQEEIDCWDRGYRLAKRMKLKVDDFKFLKLKARSVHTHIRHLFLYKNS